MPNLAALLLSVCFAVPPLLAVDVESPLPWPQFGLAGIALFILYKILNPLVKSQTDSNKHLVEAMEGIAKGQAASTEIQRAILSHVEAASAANASLVSTLSALEARMEEHLKADEDFQRRVTGGRYKPAG